VIQGQGVRGKQNSGAQFPSLIWQTKCPKSEANAPRRGFSGIIRKPMRISQSREYIASNPHFALARPLTPKELHRGQMTILYESFGSVGKEYSLEDLVRRCIERGYEDTYRDPNNDIRKSILYHLNLLREGDKRVPSKSINVL
jgi:hypothetical protein